MACPQQNNIGAKRTEKLTKYRQLAFETRELQDIRGSCRSRSTGRWYKSAKRGFEENLR